MRNGTKSFIGVVSLGLVAAGYQAGLAAEIGNGFSSTPVTNSASGVTTGATAPNGGVSTGTSAGSETLNTAAPTASAAPVTSSAPANSSAPASKPKTSSAAAAPASTPASTPSATASTAPAPVSTPKATTAPSPAATGTTKTGSAINYRYGTVQVSVTKANGKITAVNLLQAGATGGRQGAFSYLVDYAIQANGSSFGNLGGATFTTDAFKQSLESALAKF